MYSVRPRLNRPCWTIYAGSMPLGYAQETGILDKWAERYDIEIEAVQLNDYIEAQNQYTAGEFDGVIAITLDALTIPAAGGVDSTVAVLLNASNGSLLFDSSDIPNEITDALLVHTETLEQHPELGKALAGAWYEVIAMLEPDHPNHDKAIADMADAVETDRAGFMSQIATINFFRPEEAIDLVSSDDFSDGLKAMTQFAFEKGLLGEGASGARPTPPCWSSICRPTFSVRTGTLPGWAILWKVPALPSSLCSAPCRPLVPGASRLSTPGNLIGRP